MRHITLLPWPIILLPLAGGGCGTVVPDPNWCDYARDRRVGPDTETEAGAARAIAAGYLGTHLARPVWVAADGGVPEPGELDEILVESRLVESRVHLLHTRLQGESSAWCPEARLDAFLEVQARSSDREFSTESGDGSPSLYVMGYPQPGIGGIVGGRLPLERYPRAWEARITVDPGWTFDTFDLSTTIAPSHYDGAVDDPVTHGMRISVDSVLVRDEDGDDMLGGGEYPGPTLFEGYVWDLEPAEMELAPSNGPCRVVSSQPSDPDPGAPALLPDRIDVRDAAVVALAPSSRWGQLGVTWEQDPDRPAFTILRQPTDGDGACPSVVRTGVRGEVALGDGTAVFDVAGWIETADGSDGATLVGFRAGGNHREPDDPSQVQAALWELTEGVLRELRPDIEAEEPTFEVQADLYLRGEEAGRGQIGVAATVVELAGGYRGPLISGQWSTSQRGGGK